MTSPGGESQVAIGNRRFRPERGTWQSKILFSIRRTAAASCTQALISGERQIGKNRKLLRPFLAMSPARKTIAGRRASAAPGTTASPSGGRVLPLAAPKKRSAKRWCPWQHRFAG